MATQTILFDFHSDAEISRWQIVNDGVMGGLSEGRFYLDENGNGVFTGTVSLENNGGFSSVRYRPDAMDVSGHETIILKIKGDGKRYQLRVKSNRYDQHSYMTYFQTSGEWQDIELSLSVLEPTFRGMQLNMDNYPALKLEEVGFLIGNNRNESFRLEIDKIILD